mmetsp:Transcript_22601/g.65119  ORF Transcript_22601/g.65119 Transcript_22601/m.65119 type:complete len:219 (+) Transcript_22601:236-892(+)
MSCRSCRTSAASASMASLFADISWARLAFSSLHVFSVFTHSASRVAFCAVKSVSRFLRVAMMPSEWYLYVGSVGSTPARCCSRALTALRLGAATRSSASASSSALSTDCRTARNVVPTGFVLSSAWMALDRPEIAFERSAADAWYWAASCWQRRTVALSSASSSSCLALRCWRSDSLSALEAVFTSISVDSRLMLSLPLVIDVDFVSVMFWQKQANSL